MNVELIYDADCPNVADTRSLLIKAITQTGVSARWREWERSSADTPDRFSTCIRRKLQKEQGNMVSAASRRWSSMANSRIAAQAEARTRSNCVRLVLAYHYKTLSAGAARETIANLE